MYDNLCSSLHLVLLNTHRLSWEALIRGLLYMETVRRPKRELLALDYRAVDSAGLESHPNKEDMLYDGLNVPLAQFNRSIPHLAQITLCWRAEESNNHTQHHKYHSHTEEGRWLDMRTRHYRLQKTSNQLHLDFSFLYSICLILSIGSGFTKNVLNVQTFFRKWKTCCQSWQALFKLIRYLQNPLTDIKGD